MAWFLAIDFGTSVTAAAVCDSRDPVARTVHFGDRGRFPSAVLVGDEGLFSGSEVLSQARLEPHRLVLAPKRLIGEKLIRVAGRDVSDADISAAVLSVAYQEALRLYNGDPPAKVALTFPARWAEPRITCLREGAIRAGIRDPEFIPEPVAAAQALLDRDDAAADVALGSTVAVFDWGGGTLDIALMRREEDSFRQFGAPGGVENLGGEDIDEALLVFITARLPDEDRERLQDSLSGPPAVQWERASFDLRQQVRTAKEQLATNRQWKIGPLPQPPFSVDYLDVTESDLRSVIGTHIDRAVRALESTLLRNDLSFDKLSAIFLTGGSSRLTAIQRKLASYVEGQTATWGDPKALVAIGAAELIAQRKPKKPASKPPTAKPNPTTAKPKPPTDSVRGAAQQTKARQPKDTSVRSAGPQQSSAMARHPTTTQAKSEQKPRNTPAPKPSVGAPPQSSRLRLVVGGLNRKREPIACMPSLDELQVKVDRLLVKKGQIVAKDEPILVVTPIGGRYGLPVELASPWPAKIQFVVRTGNTLHNGSHVASLRIQVAYALSKMNATQDALSKMNATQRADALSKMNATQAADALRKMNAAIQYRIDLDGAITILAVSSHSTVSMREPGSWVVHAPVTRISYDITSHKDSFDGQILCTANTPDINQSVGIMLAHPLGIVSASIKLHKTGGPSWSTYSMSAAHARVRELHSGSISATLSLSLGKELHFDSTGIVDEVKFARFNPIN